MSLWCQSNIICLKDKKIWYRHLGNILTSRLHLLCYRSTDLRLLNIFLNSNIRGQANYNRARNEKLQIDFTFISTTKRAIASPHDRALFSMHVWCLLPNFKSIMQTYAVSFVAQTSVSVRVELPLTSNLHSYAFNYIHMHDKEYHTTHTRQTERINMIDINLCYG